MEIVVRGIYQNIIVGFARAVIHTYNRLALRAVTNMPDNVLTATTSANLLQQCVTAQKDRPPLLLRKFHSVSDVSNGETPRKRDHGSVRVMTWNTLADALSFGSDNFIKCPDKALEWTTRKYRCLEEILTYDPDVICLQEVDHFSDFYQPLLEQVGYKGTFKPKHYSPCLDVLGNSGPDGCAVFFKTNKFEVTDTVAKTLTAHHGSFSWKCNQVLLCQRLKCTMSSLKGQEVIVGTTHLKAKPGYDEIRHSQGLDLLEILKAYAGNLPVIIGGDFNAEPTEKVYKAFAECDLDFKSAYKLLSAGGATEPLYTTWKIRSVGDIRHTIDYMWYTHNKVTPVSVLDLPTEESVGPGRLPCHSYPSDHLSLVCDFEFKV